MSTTSPQQDYTPTHPTTIYQLVKPTVINHLNILWHCPLPSEDIQPQHLTGHPFCTAIYPQTTARQYYRIKTM
jgi:hypothetical protein